MNRPEARQVEVVGTGLIGTSVGLAASAAGYEVYLRDADERHIGEAVARGAGRPAATATSDPDLVVVAVPPSAAAAVIAESLRRYPSATVTDVSSVKAPVVAAVAASDVAMNRYVPGHPMAGRETSGPGAATVDLFRGRPWLISPVASTDSENVGVLVAFVESLGAIPQFLPSAEHDRMVALTSHTPQVVSSLMGARLAAASVPDVAVVGQGLRDVVRLAGSDAALWREILTANATEVLPVLRGFAEDLAAVVSDVERAAEADVSTGDPAESGAVIERMLREGNLGVARLPAKHGGEAADYAEVLVEIPDRPGALGSLFTEVGAADVNIEDVRIEHTLGRLTAIAHVYVLPESVEPLRAALRAGRWLVLES